MGGHEPTHVRMERVGREFRNLKARSCAMMSRDEAADTAVIFVHGFKGSPVKTWNKFNDAILAARSGEWNTSDIYFLGYNSVLSDIGAATGELTDALIRLLPSPDESFRGYVNGRAEADRTVIRQNFADYRRLILVGHSLGGVLVRNVVRQALKVKLNQARGDGKVNDLNELFPQAGLRLVAGSRLKLFAPAIGGARSAGLMGLGRLLGLDRLIFSMSGTFNELTENLSIVNSLETDTTRYAEQFPDLPCFRADIAWADNDDVVTNSEYRFDTSRTFPGTTHKSVCKPTEFFELPLTFVTGQVQTSGQWR